MNEAQWQSCEDVRAMLDFLASGRGRESELSLFTLEEGIGPRKLVLFAVACCRQVWQRLVCETTRNLIDMAEKFHDGLASEDELAGVVEAMLQAEFTQEREELSYKEHQLADAADIFIIQAAGLSLAYYGSIYSGNECYEEFIGALERLQLATTKRGTVRAAQAKALQAHLLRDVAGNPFRKSSVQREWLKWKDGTVVRLAKEIYDERRFADLPVLADALEDAGCTDGHLLGHLRGTPPHAVGCFALDELLGKK